MGSTCDRPLLERLARSLFPPGSFPEVVYSRAADEVAHHSWVCQVLRRELPDTPAPDDARPAGDVVARLAGSAPGVALLDVISDAAVRAALDTARTERAAAGRLAPPA